MAGTCATCRFWRGGRFGMECDRIGMTDAMTREPMISGPNDAAMAVDVADDSGLDARLITGPDFGCVLHEARGETRS